MKYLLKKSLFILAALTVFGTSGCKQKANDKTNNGTKSAACEITKFVFMEADNASLKGKGDINGTIDATAKTIKFSIPEGVAVTALKPAITVSDKAKITPANGAVQDFSKPVVYTVIAEDGKTKNEYTVTELLGCEITKFSFNETDNAVLKGRGNYDGAIDEASKTIKVSIPKGVALKDLKPSITISNKAKITPANGAVQDFSKPVKYTVTAKDGKAKSEYTVTVADDYLRLADYMTIRSGEVKGILTKSSQEQIDAIFNGDQNVVVEVLGPKARIIIGSKYYMWSSIEKNGENVKLHPGYTSRAFGLMASAYIPLELPKVGMELDITLSITDPDGNSGVLKFKVKRSAGTVDVPAIFTILDERAEFKDKKIKKNVYLALCDGTNPEFITDVDSTKITVSCKEDAMKSVNIGGQVISGTSIKKITTAQGEDRWIAEARVNSSAINSDVVVTIEPKDTSIYRTLTWTFRLHKIDLSDNAEFQYFEWKGDIRPRITLSGVYNKQDEELSTWKDFGAYKAKYVVYTKARTSRVWYQFVDFEGNGLPGCDAKEMTPHDNKSHTADVILFEDKPTPIRIWVVSGSGKTDKGNPKSDFLGAIFNKVNVFYGYEEKTEITTSTFESLKPELEGYTCCFSEITVDKASVKDNKIYLAFEMYREKAGAAPGNIPPEYNKQTPFKKLGDSIEETRTQWYGTTVDVSGLSNSGDHLDILLPISPANDLTKILFPYKLTVKLK